MRGPLVVDLDGCLLRTDLFLEGATRLVLRSPGQLVGALRAALRGKAALKMFVASRSGPDLDTVPLEPAVVRLIEDALGEGRRVILASGAHRSQVERIGSRVGVTEIYGTEELLNLTGERKLARIRTTCDTFDYVGNDRADLALWGHAGQAFAINANPLTLWRARRLRRDLVVVPSSRAPLTAMWKALRPHQWAKNGLIVLPALAAHLTWNVALLGTMLAGFLAFSLAASAVYLSNDLSDLHEDRRHRSKRRRPLAAGDLSVPTALALMAALAIGAVAVAWPLPQGFRVSLALYVLLAVAYNFVLKRRPLADVMALASLYTVRVVAGAALVSVSLSRWFLAFSVFLFLSLALVKRVVELKNRPNGDTGNLPGRSYRPEDLPVLTGLGLGATAASTLVYCLYITSTDVLKVYHHPDLLWLGLLMLLYWQGRVWLLTGRNQMTEDPVVFALRDRVSLVLLVAFMVKVVIAA